MERLLNGFLAVVMLLFTMMLLASIALPAQVEVVRTLSITDTVNQDVKAAGAEMWEELRKTGCQEAHLFGWIEKAGEIQLILRCEKWQEEVKPDAPKPTTK